MFSKKSSTEKIIFLVIKTNPEFCFLNAKSHGAKGVRVDRTCIFRVGISFSTEPDSILIVKGDEGRILVICLD